MRASIVAALAASSAILLGGCTTLREPPRYAYYRVPCTTPGAVVATPVAMQATSGAVYDGSPALLRDRSSASEPSVSDTAPVPAVTKPQAGVTCVVAVSEVGSGYGRSYYPSYRGGYYGRPFYGSFGIGIGLGHGGGHGFGGHGYAGHGLSGGHGGRHH